MELASFLEAGANSAGFQGVCVVYVECGVDAAKDAAPVALARVSRDNVGSNGDERSNVGAVDLRKSNHLRTRSVRRF